MLMSVNTENGSAQGQTTVLEKESVYASLFDKINLTPATSLGDINAFLDDAALSDAPAGERLTAAMQVFMDCIRKSGQPVEKLDKTLIDHHIAELDFQISRQLDAVMHHAEFQKVESLWRGLKQLVDNTDYLVRGVQIEVTLDSHGFAGRGDICLFGEMLSRFFALYTDIYLFNRLIIILQPTGERLEWEEKHNRRIPG
ncbi:type VI secretion system baseplate subunit TssF [Enterobacter cloacae]